MGAIQRERGGFDSSAARSGRTPPPTVLIVDDEPLMRTVMKRVLADEGYAVVTAAGGAEALEIVARGASIDLVLTDLLMPGIDGVELSARLRAIRPGLPIVVMSAAAEPIGIKRLAQPPDALLEKPFETEALARCVRGLLDRVVH
jgi:two-component system cell cycle sensor histidine kinase/response regulator CckA